MNTSSHNLHNLQLANEEKPQQPVTGCDLRFDTWFWFRCSYVISDFQVVTFIGIGDSSGDMIFSNFGFMTSVGKKKNWLLVIYLLTIQQWFLENF